MVVSFAGGDVGAGHVVGSTDVHTVVLELHAEADALTQGGTETTLLSDTTEHWRLHANVRSFTSHTQGADSHEDCWGDSTVHAGRWEVVLQTTNDFGVDVLEDLQSLSFVVGGVGAVKDSVGVHLGGVFDETVVGSVHHGGGSFEASLGDQSSNSTITLGSEAFTDLTGELCTEAELSDEVVDLVHFEVSSHRTGVEGDLQGGGLVAAAFESLSLAPLLGQRHAAGDWELLGDSAVNGVRENHSVEGLVAVICSQDFGCEDRLEDSEGAVAEIGVEIFQ